MRKTLILAAYLVPAILVSACNDNSSTKTKSDTKSSNRSVSEPSSAHSSTPSRQAILSQRIKTAKSKVSSLLSQLTLEEKISLVHASGKFHVNAIERLGIPELWLSDGPHGVRHQIQRNSWDSADWKNDYATYLPHLTSVAASWDVNMATLHGKVLGSEARSRGKDIILGPGVNLARTPVNGRNFEYMGEDPFLASTLVVPEVIAIQQQDVAANVKHFALNNQELNRIGVNAKPDERTLREVYLPVFEAAVKQGHVDSLMGAYNQYYGSNVNQSKHLVHDILKGEWGFDGVLLTDWNVDINTQDAAINGLDLEMGTNVKNYNDYFLADPFLAKIKSGEISESVLNDKVTRILNLMVKIGAFDNNRLKGERNTKAHQQAARKIAASGVILLKNETIAGAPILPLSADKIKNILVLGPNANKKHGSGGGSSEVKTPYEITPLQGLKNALGGNVNITVMRARSSVLSPIASDYIASRHWTGTPAWNISYFADQAHTTLLNESWIVDSQFNNNSTKVNADTNTNNNTNSIAANNSTENTNKKAEKEAVQHITMTAEIKPLKSGLHSLKLLAKGQFKLLINGKEVIFKANSIKATPNKTISNKTISNKTSDKPYDSAIMTHDVVLNAGKVYKFEINYDGNDNFTLGWDAPGNLFTSEAEYLTAAKKADAVIYFGGLSHADDRESIDRPDLVLPNNQNEVIAKLLKANKKTIIFMVAGSAVEMPWVEQASALVWGWYGGMEAGNAFADIIFGKVNPNGKLPITLPVNYRDTAPIALNDYNATETLYKEGVFIGYRWFEKQNIKPLFSFGYGLSYTNFTYSDIAISPNKTSLNLDGRENADETLTVTATIKNTGKVAGAEIVQLYLTDLQASVERPLKELKGFTKVFLQPQESKQISITLTKRDLSFWDIKSHNWLAEKGEFEIMLASSVNDIRLKQRFSFANKNK